jgi:hypothetical protein
MCEDPTSRGDRQLDALRFYHDTHRRGWCSRLFERRRLEADSDLVLGLLQALNYFEMHNPPCPTCAARRDEDLT